MDDAEIRPGRPRAASSGSVHRDSGTPVAAGSWQASATTYLRGPEGTHQAFGLAVLTVTGAGIARILVFGDPGLVTRFGFPPVAVTPRRGCRDRDVEIGMSAPTSR